MSAVHPIPSSGAFALILRARLRPERRQETLAVLEEIRRNDDTEPGTLVQAFHLDADDENVIWIYELWEDESALEFHRANLAPWRERLVAGFLAWPTPHVAVPITAKGLPGIG